MSEKRKKSFPYPIREFVDADYLSKLSKEEREWYYQFENEYYNNNHRKGEIINKQDNYESEIKKELDDQSNATRRDVYNNHTRVTVRSNDISNVIYDSYSGHINESLKKKGIEKTVLELIAETAIDIIAEHGVIIPQKDLENTLSMLCIDVTKAIQLEKKYRRNTRRKK